MSNPLLNFDKLPRFTAISASHAVPALDQVLQDSRAKIADLCEINRPDWENFARPMEDLDERISRVWSPVAHLNGVQDSDELRDAFQTGIELLTEYHSETGQNQALFKQYKLVKQGNTFQRLTKAQQKIIDNNLLDFRLSGADLDPAKQDRIREISQKLSRLSTQFERNLLDATQAWSLNVTDESRLVVLPPSSLKMARQTAQMEGQDGWLFSLQIPSYMAVMQHAQDTNLRHEMYRAYSIRASELADFETLNPAEPGKGKFDNAPLIDQILALRHEQAQLLDFATYADYSLVKKMAESSDTVMDFLAELANHARPVAVQELVELQDYALQYHDVQQLQAWDIAYFSERLREHRYAFSDEEVRPYFPAPLVLDGLFEITRQLFGVEIISNSKMQVWHDDVRCFDLVNPDRKVVIGSLYMDLYVRKNKRGGAWMDSCVHRRQSNGKLQKPVAFLTCNFTPPIGNEPALLSHNEVETLFHEFGHSLHHLLTEVDEMGVSGINGVAWDAVELPSQFLENWCWQEQCLRLIAKHFQSGQSLPVELLQKMRAAKHFQSGMQTLRQIEFAMFDMRLHRDYDPVNHSASSVQAVLDEVRDEVAVLRPPVYNRFQNSFGHIFAGGYAAGYYSYKWSEVLSADAFGRFEEEGILNAETGRDFLHSILQRGGVDDPNDLFFEFRQRPPAIEALLQHSGLKQTGKLA